MSAHAPEHGHEEHGHDAGHGHDAAHGDAHAGDHGHGADHGHGGGHDAAHGDAHGANHGHDAGHGHDAAHGDSHGAGHGHDAHGNGHGHDADHGHGADAHGDAHGAAHGADAHAKAETTADKSPIARARDWVWGKVEGVFNGTKGLFNSFRSAIGFKTRPPVKPEGIIINTASAVGNVLDGTALNTVRRATDIIEPVGEGAAAVVDATLGTVLHLEEIVTKPGKTFLKKPAHIVTAGLNTVARAIKAPIDFLHDTISIGIDRTIANTREALGKVPGIGGLLKAIPAPAQWISGIAKSVTESVQEVFRRITAPVENMHYATAPA